MPSLFHRVLSYVFQMGGTLPLTEQAGLVDHPMYRFATYQIHLTFFESFEAVLASEIPKKSCRKCDTQDPNPKNRVELTTGANCAA